MDAIGASDSVLGIAETAIGLLRGVLLPEQLLCRAFALQLLVHGGLIGHLVAQGKCGIGAGIEQGRQVGVVHFHR